MINYMKSELYKVSRNKMTYIYLGSLIVLICALPLLLNLYNSSNGMEYDAVFLLEGVRINTFNLPLYLTIMITSLVFSEEYKNRTMTNSISFGFNRAQIYFGKFIVQTLVAMIFAVVAFGVLILSSWLILGFNSSMSESISLLFTQIIAAFPIWLAGLAIANALAFIFNSTMTFAIIFMTLVVIIPSVLDTIALFTDKLNFIKDHLLSCQFSTLNLVMNDGIISNANMRYYYSLGAVYFIVSILLGYFTYRKKEIK